MDIKKKTAFLFYVHTQKEIDNSFSKIVHSVNEMEVKVPLVLFSAVILTLTAL